MEKLNRRIEDLRKWINDKLAYREGNPGEWRRGEWPRGKQGFKKSSVTYPWKPRRTVISLT